MKTVYISSTYQDLKDYRRAVAEALRDCDYQVIGMEKFRARDKRPTAACEADASKCDIYIGIIAWRYGFVPDKNNPEKRSITELEYLAAERKPRLIFLSSDGARDPRLLRDADRGRIRRLRDRLNKQTWTASFKSPEDLSTQVLISVFQHESTKRSESIEAIEEIKSAKYIGKSYLRNIQKKIEKLSNVEFATILLGGTDETCWWNTRLHLVAALASDFTNIRHFLLLDFDGKFLAMVSPAELRRALTKAEPRLEKAYLESRRRGADAVAIINRYQAAVETSFDGRERKRRQVVSGIAIGELGLKQEAEILTGSAKERKNPLYFDVMKGRLPYVVLVRNDKLEGIVDRTELLSRITKILLR